MSFLKKRIAQKKNGGFTLIELLVTIVIFVILTGVVLFNQNGFNNTVLINNLAYDIALTIRQAQNYGVDVNESQVNTFNAPYGVVFNTGNNKNFILFADTGTSGGVDTNGNPVPDYKYTGSGSCLASDPSDPECIQKYNISSGSYIKSICTKKNGSACTLTNSLTILFQRPNPDALIYSDTGSADFADITVASASGVIKDIIITGVGQIYVQK